MRFRLPLLFALTFTCGAGIGAASPGLKPVHAVHAKNEIECSVCHADAESSTRGTDVLLPKKDTCAACHEVQDTAQCGLCHTDVSSPSGYTPRVVVAQNFPHATHVSKGMNCAACHTSQLGLEPVLPDKAGCRTCHVTASQQADCRICHAAGEELVPASHGPQFLQLHAVQASWNQARCAVCHTQTDCQECHHGDDIRPRTHPLDYFFAHSLDARSKETSCRACHQTEFCSDCHAAQRLLPSNHSQANWLLPDGGAHAIEGRFDMESCAACHEAGSSAPTCARCHGK